MPRSLPLGALLAPNKISVQIELGPEVPPLPPIPNAGEQTPAEPHYGRRY